MTELYQCDMYYHECSKRGKIDEFDIRKDRKGFILPHRVFCTDGIYPSDIPKPCIHCIEYKNLYRKPPERKSSRVSSYTVYESMYSGTSVNGAK
jgi:hypothetical protein